MKKFLYFVLGFSLAFSLNTFAQTTLFTDVAYDAYYIDNLNYFTSAGVIKGYGDGTFKPTNNISRAETVTILKRYDDFVRDRSRITINNLNFSEKSAPGQSAGEINYNMSVNFYTSKAARISVSGGSRQISDDAYKQDHSIQIPFSFQKDTLPRTFHFTIEATDSNGIKVTETRDYTFIE